MPAVRRAEMVVGAVPTEHRKRLFNAVFRASVRALVAVRVRSGRAKLDTDTRGSKT
jgi:hypothetical protein